MKGTGKPHRNEVRAAIRALAPAWREKGEHRQAQPLQGDFTEGTREIASLFEQTRSESPPTRSYGGKS